MPKVLPPLNLTRTRKALEEYDKTKVDRDAKWDAAVTNKALEAAMLMDEEALNTVRRAYLEDTKDRSYWDRVKICDLQYLRRMVEKYGGRNSFDS